MKEFGKWYKTQDGGKVKFLFTQVVNGMPSKITAQYCMADGRDILPMTYDLYFRHRFAANNPVDPCDPPEMLDSVSEISTRQSQVEGWDARRENTRPLPDHYLNMNELLYDIGAKTPTDY